ncbi:hypothetical protein [Paenibacillus sp. HW567]|uniref:hypothetical protein n=1 Tax=Paenibacillus sp. HW567 TaxID=1034769 RepID=UPI0003821296|nr:hypothetical protein [Paenibacillus sp. HW567]
MRKAAIEVINGRFGTITQYRDNPTKNEEAQEIDLNGLFILPGLISCAYQF